jgi:4-hydroxy-3-methylbut-2-enyl diphosphate reductase
MHGAPVYVRKEIVHNKFVVEQLSRRGAVFVESENDVPEGATVVFSAHGVAPSVHARARARNLDTIDATCPLVTKVHVEAKKFAADGYTIVLIGHAGHEEVEGTMGEAPESIVLVESEDDVDRLEVQDPSRIAYISQTTLSVDETRSIINRLRQRFPAIVGPRTDDICYATTNRQAAVKQLAVQCDLVLVIGSRNSSNSNRLVEVAREHGADSYLIDNETEVREEWLAGKRVVGITSGASAPESLVQRLVEFFQARGTIDVHELEVVQEDVRFMLPKVIRQAVAASSA